jgi:hypothetical protein
MIAMAWFWLLADEVPPTEISTRSPYVLYGGIAVGIIVLLGIFMALARRKRPEKIDPEEGMEEDLLDYPEPPPLAGSRQATYQGQPVRVRLVVVAPVGRQEVSGDGDMEPILNQVVRGLGTMARQDEPQVRTWPLGMSNVGFTPMFFRRVLRPEPAGTPSNWILVAGPARAGASRVLLGMALWSDEETTIGNVAVQQDEWGELLRIEKAR